MTTTSVCPASALFVDNTTSTDAGSGTRAFEIVTVPLAEGDVATTSGEVAGPAVTVATVSNIPNASVTPPDCAKDTSLGPVNCTTCPSKPEKLSASITLTLTFQSYPGCAELTESATVACETCAADVDLYCATVAACELPLER